MMLFLDGTEDIDDMINGTPLMSALYRLNGATVGKDCCIFTSHMEYDLVELGDCTTLGEEISHQCHTVERMVVKLAHFQAARGCTLRARSVAMPGSKMEDNSTLLELSQILKGDTVGEGQTWAGLPGGRVRGKGLSNGRHRLVGNGRKRKEDVEGVGVPRHTQKNSVEVEVLAQAVAETKVEKDYKEDSGLERAEQVAIAVDAGPPAAVMGVAIAPLDF